MKVELIAYSIPANGENKNPTSVVEECASVCYDSKPTENYRIANSCYRSGHMSVWEHISFTFHIEDVSRSLLAQLTRHRIASFSVRSQRYCNEESSGYIKPKFRNHGSNEIYQESILDSKRYYKYLVDNGEEKEDARQVLPNATYTELYMTMNARELMQSSNIRLCSNAQDEIRQLFISMKNTVADVCPEVASKMVPQCEKIEGFPFCTENKSCGRHPKLKDVYRAIENK